jgi:hypothetical protein
VSTTVKNSPYLPVNSTGKRACGGLRPKPRRLSSGPVVLVASKRSGSMNPDTPFHLPLLHTLVEERAGVRRFPSRFEFIGRVAASPGECDIARHGPVYDFNPFTKSDPDLPITHRQKTEFTDLKSRPTVANTRNRIRPGRRTRQEGSRVALNTSVLIEPLRSSSLEE